VGSEAVKERGVLERLDLLVNHLNRELHRVGTRASERTDIRSG
jgi:hypothetical protein